MPVTGQGEILELDAALAPGAPAKSTLALWAFTCQTFEN
jgi:hypothetical protein